MPRLLVTALTATLALVLAGAAVADGPPRRQTTPVLWHAQAVALEEDIDAGPVQGASASLVATSTGASVTVRTRELVPGHAYTLWYVIVNNPAACQATPCSGADILTNPDVDAQVTYGAGHIVGGAGQATFAAHRDVGPIDGWLPDRTFHNPLGAEYHVALNDHGPKLAVHMPDMIRTYRGGCSDDSPFPPIFPATALADGEPGPNRCLLYQVAIFQP